MTMRKKHWLLIALAILVSLALAACGGGNKKATPTQEPAASAKAAATEAAQPSAAAGPTEAPNLTEAPAAEESTLSLDSREAGLDKLTSYRVTWHAEWKSTEQGKTDSGTWDWTEEYTAEPKAHHLSMKSPDSSDATKPNQFEMWQIGDTTYMKSGDDQECMSFSSEGAGKDSQQGLFNPSMLGRIQDGKYVGTDTINGVPAKHYTYSSKADTLVGLGDVSGETWVATDGGYVVKDTVSWKGSNGFFGMGGSSGTGEGSWTWELSDANKPFTINPPEGCGGPQLDLPMMADAKEKSRFGNMTTYKSASKVADVVAFYKDKLAADGWTPEGEPTEMGDIAMLNFTKDGQTLSVTVSSGDDGTQVMLNVGE
jgi:hypothetical protein